MTEIRFVPGDYAIPKSCIPQPGRDSTSVSFKYYIVATAIVNYVSHSERVLHLLDMAGKTYFNLNEDDCYNENEWAVACRLTKG